MSARPDPPHAAPAPPPALALAGAHAALRERLLRQHRADAPSLAGFPIHPLLASIGDGGSGLPLARSALRSWQRQVAHDLAGLPDTATPALRHMRAELQAADAALRRLLAIWDEA